MKTFTGLTLVAAILLLTSCGTATTAEPSTVDAADLPFTVSIHPGGDTSALALPLQLD